MVRFLRSTAGLLVALILITFLGSCTGGGSAGLNSFQSPDGRYLFFYPTGWSRVAVTGGPQIVFHDLINSDETLSLVVSEVGQDVDLTALGSPETVGERLMTEVIAPKGTGRDVELVEAKERDLSGHTFYDLEYSIYLSDRKRHELATVVVDKGLLYTLAASTNEERWPKVESLFRRVISSFTFLI